MQEVTFTDFRNHAKRYFDSVEHGATVRIYRNGRPIWRSRSRSVSSTCLETTAFNTHKP